MKILRFGQTNPRRLLLIALDWTRPKDPPLSLGHASIYAHLRKHGVSVEEASWAVNDPSFCPSQVTKHILKCVSHDLDVALGAFIWNENYIQSILKSLSTNKFPGRIILGGPQVSYVKKGIEAYYPTVDVFVRGYAEEPMLRLYESKEAYPSIHGVHYKGQTDLGLTSTAELKNLTSPFLSGIVQPQRFIRWETQRGCPFRCSFCQHRESDDTMQRRYYDPERIEHEIAWIHENPIIQDIAVLDPTFNSGPNYLNILKQFSEKKYSGKLSLQCRIEMVKPEFLNIVEKINQSGNVVLEFGLQTIHRKEQILINRPNNLTKVKAVLEETNRRGIETEISLIFGLPGQTVNSFRQSILFCQSLKATKIYAFPLMLLRGTPLHHNKQKLGLIESSDININYIPRIQTGIPHVVTSKSFDYKDWQQMADMAASLEEYNRRVANTSTAYSMKSTNIAKSSVSALPEKEIVYAVSNQYINKIAPK